MSSTAAAALSSWVPVSPDSDFSIYNLPYGVISRVSEEETTAARHVATAIGDYALDLYVLAEAGVFASSTLLKGGAVFREPTLNAFMALSRAAWKEARATLLALLDAANPQLRDNADLRARALVPLAQVRNHLPVAIGDYTDFYSSRNHAYNVGVMFRGPDNALQPNWTHLPVGYHGRASSVVVSGTNVHRPRGQLCPDESKPPVHDSCKTLDFELEMGMFVGGAPNPLGHPLSMREAEERMFGLVVLNDWSARDVQKWEYVPLGPFTAKNFATTISPWIITFEALEPFRIAGQPQTPAPLPYLREANDNAEVPAYDIRLEVTLQSPSMAKPHTISVSNAKYLYWSFKQQLVHHTVTGCTMRPGDMLGSGTISGPEPHEYGSMLELCWKGTKDIVVSGEPEATAPAPAANVRKFLRDGDEVNMKGVAMKEGGVRVGFGDCKGRILPCVPLTL